MNIVDIDVCFSLWDKQQVSQEDAVSIPVNSVYKR